MHVVGQVLAPRRPRATLAKRINQIDLSKKLVAREERDRVFPQVRVVLGETSGPADRTYRYAGNGLSSPASVTRCMMRRTFALSNGSTECMVHRLSHIMTSSFAQTWR